MGALDDGIVMFGRRRGRPRRGMSGWEWGGVHVAIAPVPHRGQWTAECGIALPASDKSVSAVHGGCIVDDRSTRVCWLPPEACMEQACYLCMRRAGATHVMGVWQAAPPPPPQHPPRRGASARRS